MVSMIRLSVVAMLALSVFVGCETQTMLRERGREAMLRENYMAARDAYARAVDRWPNDYVSLYQLGRAHLQLGQPLEAQLVLERALTLAEADQSDESYPAGLREKILDQLAEAYYQQEKYPRLTSYFGQIAEETHDPDDYLRLARYLVKMGDVDAAATAYKKAALFAGSASAEPYLAVADFYRSIGDRANERIALRYAYHVNPADPSVNQRLRELGVVPGPTAGLEPPTPGLP